MKRTILAAIISLSTFAQTLIDYTTPDTYECGQNQSSLTYRVDEEALICLFFDQLDPVKKVVFTPKVDNFEVLQIKGLYEKFEQNQEGDLTVTAMSNGIASRPAVFKKNLEAAPILNLVVGLDKGAVIFLEWRNNCFDQQAIAKGCDVDDCKDSSVKFNGEKYVEHNCFRTDCADENVDSYECDTQVFVTWVGRDNDRDDMTSDNYRISGFYDFGIVSYLEAAWGLWKETYDQNFGESDQTDGLDEPDDSL